MALAVMFYLYDSSALLFTNEVILTCGSARPWSATTGRTGYTFAGRSLCILNPFTPHRPSFRLSWDFDGLDPARDDLSWPARAQEFKKLAPMALTAGIALFVLLPLGMFTPLGAYAVVPAVLLLYGSTLLALFQLWRRRSLVALDDRRFWGLTFECLACPPFAVNLIRRITLAYRITEPVPLAAVRLLDAEDWTRLKEHCIACLDEAMQLVAEHSDQQRSLEAQKQRLRALVSRA